MTLSKLKPRFKLVFVLLTEPFNSTSWVIALKDCEIMLCSDEKSYEVRCIVNDMDSQEEDIELQYLNEDLSIVSQLTIATVHHQMIRPSCRIFTTLNICIHTMSYSEQFPGLPSYIDVYTNNNLKLSINQNIQVD